MSRFSSGASLIVLACALYVSVVGIWASDVSSVDRDPLIPSAAPQVDAWFWKRVRPHWTRRGTIDPNLEAAEDRVKVIKVRKDGKGDFGTLTDAINSIPAGNSQRVIVWIGAGVYREKVKIERTKPFVTLYVSPNEAVKLTYNGNALKYGTVDSATLIIESDYFMAVNLVIENSSPRPTRKNGEQAVALRLSGDKAALYKCRLLGFQDTLCDDRGFHLFKDCYIEGTVDFIFGSGTSLYLTTELRVLGDNKMTMITAQARESSLEDTGYSFVHCIITGTGTGTVLGRAWRSSPRVIFSYTNMSSVITPLGWSNNFHPEYNGKVEFGEYANQGPGAKLSGRATFTKVLNQAQAAPFLSLTYIVGSKWLLPPPAL